jgi:hypothetical protein
MWYLGIGPSGTKNNPSKILEAKTWIETYQVLHKFSEQNSRELLELNRKQLRQLRALLMIFRRYMMKTRPM